MVARRALGQLVAESGQCGAAFEDIDPALRERDLKFGAPNFFANCRRRRFAVSSDIKALRKAEFGKSKFLQIFIWRKCVISMGYHRKNLEIRFLRRPSRPASCCLDSGFCGRKVGMSRN
jgi:hypothetical protein